MKFSSPLKSASLIKRYKRFLTDVRLADNSTLTMHCPNTGSMKNCAVPGSRIWYSRSESKTRKYPHTFELVELDDNCLASINTGRANHLVREAVMSGVISELKDYRVIKAEVKYGKENSRIDFVLSEHPDYLSQECYVEVKSVTLGVGGGLGLFPDAVTTRGLKHLRELVQMKALGHRAILLFCVQHTGISKVEPADEIDPEYGQGLRHAVEQGVEVIAYKAAISNQEIYLEKALPVVLPHL